MAEVKSNYDEMFETFMSNCAKAYADSPRNNDTKTQSERCRTEDRYKVYNIEIKRSAATAKNSRKKVKRKKSSAAKISAVLIAFSLIFCVVANNLDTAKYVFHEVTSNVASIFSGADTADNSDLSEEAYSETLYNIKPEIWEMLSYDERLWTIENLKNIELNYLGVSKDILLVITELEDSTLGEYSDNIIKIDEYYFNNSPIEEIVETVCHECRHAYQHACIEAYYDADESFQDLYMFTSTKIYADNWFNYIEYDAGKDNYDEYYNQPIESDSFSYASQRAQVYYSELIPEYAYE